MLAFANAKINLGLQVTEKRADGYHNLETVFYPLKINDVVEITDAPVTSFVSSGISIPGDAADNLCLKAYNALKRDFDIPPQQITLLKNIPIGAGLGGGSSDAAFLVKLLNDKFSLGLSTLEMEDYVRPLGADCAFFIRNKPVYAEGKGDEFSPVELNLSAYEIVLVQPHVQVSTADAYRGIIPSVPSSSVKDLIHLPPNDWKSHIFNDFETTVFEKYPQIEKVKMDLYHSGAIFALMSGSGSSVFGIFAGKVKLAALERENKVFYGC
ncbi:4-(cytidine 5'-diphospho)-2-C-methyl-D-erythritol kinase [Pedobacter sp. JCM 36344]|uniref:4-(cytidine 5'-diphospho)-2-C-methyl-D-erythritol kinase n=1 Tax=Pedobacter sp. JCM 36344 TaxID=3374280 RepID=UPI003978EC06